VKVADLVNAMAASMVTDLVDKKAVKLVDAKVDKKDDSKGV